MFALELRLFFYIYILLNLRFILQMIKNIRNHIQMDQWYGFVHAHCATGFSIMCLHSYFAIEPLCLSLMIIANKLGRCDIAYISF